MMKTCVYLFLLFISACADPKDQDTTPVAPQHDSEVTTIQNKESHRAINPRPVEKEPETEPRLPQPKAVKRPDGIYQGLIPYKEKNKIEQTIAFYNNNTFLLQEKYDTPNKDSIVQTRGNWSPSDGYIWLYKEQVVRGRYSWKGDTLRYFNPEMKKHFAMHAVKDVRENDRWQEKKAQGLVFMGIGNEPFWSLELDKEDSLSFSRAGWDHPLKMKLDTTFSATSDSTFYVAQNDSVSLKVTVLPYFCNDGMSDYIYENMISVQYNQEELKGCGVVFSQESGRRR
jgi:uncharacterized membrane protein